MSSPVEQFEIKKIIPLEFNGIDLSFTNSSLCMMITIAVILLSMGFCLRKRDVVPTMAQTIPEAVYEFILSIMGETLGKNGIKYFSFVFDLCISTYFVHNIIHLQYFQHNLQHHLIDLQ